MSFSSSNKCWTAGSHGRVLNGPGDQRHQFAKDIELTRNLLISVWSQCQTEKTKHYVENMHDFPGTVAQMFGDHSFRNHHFTSRALPVQKFPSYGVGMGSQRTRTIKSLLQFPSFTWDHIGSKFSGVMSSESEIYAANWHSAQLTPSPFPIACLKPCHCILE